MKRPNEYELHTTIRYNTYMCDGIARKDQLLKWAEQAEKMDEYITYLENCLVELEQVKNKPIISKNGYRRNRHVIKG